MAIRIHVKHFLNAVGLEYFPIWFKEVQGILRQQPGFIAIQHWKENEDPNCINLHIDFENDELRSRWGTSDLHHEIVGKLDPYRTKPYEATRFQWDIQTERTQ